MKNKIVIGHLMALFVAIVWGTTFVSTKLLLQSFHPIEIMLFRFCIAWVVLFCCSPKPLRPKSIKAELPFMGAGLTGLVLYFIFENFALSYTFVANVGIIISAAPMFTALLLWLFRRASRPRWTFFLGFALAMTGITIISISGGDQVGISPIGDFLTLGAAFAWGCYGICIELTQPQGYSDLQVTRKVFFYGIIFTSPFIYFCNLDLSLARFADPTMLFNILYLGLGASALCFVLWNTAVLYIGSLATSVYIYLMPVIALIASVLILPEPVNIPASVVAIVLILLGLQLSQRKRPEKILSSQ